jgi:hypothetical protein
MPFALLVLLAAPPDAAYRRDGKEIWKAPRLK